jgi:hypothetical protein
MKRRTWAKWDPPIPAGFPVGLVMHPSGANRRQRRKSREHQDDPMPPSSMVPHVKRLNEKTMEVEYVAQR